jgi:hypothetical protein
MQAYRQEIWSRWVVRGMGGAGAGGHRWRKGKREVEEEEIPMTTGKVQRLYLGRRSIGGLEAPPAQEAAI